MADKKHKRGKAASKGKTKAASPPGPDARTVAIGVTAGLGAIAAIMVGFLGLSRRRPTAPRGAEHAAPDLAADAPPVGSQRAPEAFRPDPTAAVPASERDALRPATGAPPSLAAVRGEMANQTGAANG